MPGSSPTPSPSAGSAPKPPTPTSAPTVPDYQGAAGASTQTSTTGGNDIWGLGQMYGLPVLLGSSTSSPGSYTGGEQSQRRGGVGVKTSDQYGTTQDIMSQVVDLWAQQQVERQQNPHGLTGYEQLQQALYAGGFYGQTSYDKVHVGQWTSQTQQAMNAALQQYEQVARGAQTPITFTEFIQGNAAQNGDGGINAPNLPAAQPVVLTDPNQIMSAAQQAAEDALGRGLSPDQMKRFVAKFQSAQTAAQTATSGTVSTPDLGSAAMAFAQGDNPGAFQENQRTAYLDQMVNLLGGGLTSRPNQTPVPSVGGK